MRIEVNVLIVEDEQKASEALEDLIKMVMPGVHILPTASTVEQAIEAIKQSEPQLVFLDIQLGEEESFQILRRISNQAFEIIFVTAYSDYAVEAFKFSAVDYLLKPIDPDRLSQAMEEAVDRIKTKQRPKKIDALLDNLATKQPKKLVLTTLDFVHVVDINNIIKCQSSVNYTIFYIRGEKEILVSKTLKEFDEQLTPHGFFRAHKSWLINMNYVKGYNKKEGGAILEDGGEVPVSTAKKEDFMEALKSYF